jgi:hypothetical protein
MFPEAEGQTRGVSSILEECVNRDRTGDTSHQHGSQDSAPSTTKNKNSKIKVMLFKK